MIGGDIFSESMRAAATMNIPIEGASAWMSLICFQKCWLMISAAERINPTEAAKMPSSERLIIG
jgi:hypothetical protein